MMHYSHPNIIVMAANDNMVLLQGGGGGVLVCGAGETHECAGSIFRVIKAQR